MKSILPKQKMVLAAMASLIILLIAAVSLPQVFGPESRADAAAGPMAATAPAAPAAGAQPVADPAPGADAKSAAAGTASENDPAAPTTTASATTDDSTTTAPAQTAGAAHTAQPFADFRLRPFEAAYATKTHAWTAVDGNSKEFIAQVAHNALEAQRLQEESARIHRRQLVYRNDPVAAVMQRAKAQGESVGHIVLPGLDGQEYGVVITGRELNPSSQIGTLSGYVEGRPTSMVTIAYKFGREAFTIAFPEENYYLQGDPREPGEVVVKSFDPAIYIEEFCGVE